MGASDGERGPGRARRAGTGRANLMVGLRAIEDPGAPVRRARCCAHMGPPPFCTHTQRTVPDVHELQVRKCLNRGGRVASNVGIAHKKCCNTDKSVPRAFPD